MNYSNIIVISGKVDLNTIFQLLNDESRSLDLININDSTDLVVVRFDTAAKEAKNIIDSYLSAYALPFTEVPTRIADLSDDLTIYNIYKRRRESMPDSIISTYNQAIKTLENIQRGNIELPVARKPTEGGNGIFQVNKSAKDKVFNDNLMRRY